MMIRPAWDWGPLLDENRISAGYQPLNTDQLPLTEKSNGANHFVNGDPMMGTDAVYTQEVIP